MMCRIFTTFTQFSNSYLNSVWLCHVKIHQINESNDLRLLNNNDLSSLSSCDSDLHSQVYSQLLVLLFLTFILWLFFYTHTHSLGTSTFDSPNLKPCLLTTRPQAADDQILQISKTCHSQTQHEEPEKYFRIRMIFIVIALCRRIFDLCPLWKHTSTHHHTKKIIISAN